MANLDKPANEKAIAQKIYGITGASDELIAKYSQQAGGMNDLLNNADLMEALEREAQSIGSAIAPSQPKAPAKRGTGRKAKNTEVPTNGIQHAQTKIGAEIQAVESQIEGHLSQWEQMKAQQLVERFEAVPGNITRMLSEELGGYSDDAESFRERIGAALSSAFPLS